MTQSFCNNPYSKREAPFSLHLIDDERERLNRSAGSMPLVTYIKSLLFAENAPWSHSAHRNVIANEKALAELLTTLGANRVPNNLNQLAKAANSGNLYFDHETKLAINRACDDITNIRLLLMRTLGISASNENTSSDRTSHGFTCAAVPKKTF